MALHKRENPKLIQSSTVIKKYIEFYDQATPDFNSSHFSLVFVFRQFIYGKLRKSNWNKENFRCKILWYYFWKFLILG